MASAAPILDGDLLRAFVAFAETRSFTQAARLVGLSQPALFERVRRLSDDLGAPLYERRGRELVLTERGLRVAAHAREALARADAFVRELNGERPQEVVTLAAGEGAFLYLLGPALARFSKAGAADEGVADLRLRTLGGPAACEAVRAGEADLGVAVIDLVPAGLLARDILRTPLCVALPRRHRLARRRSLRLADLAGERLLLPPEGSAHRDFIGRAVARLGHEVDTPIEADGWPLMLAFTAFGLGVSVVNAICTAPRGVVLRPLPELGTVCYRLVVRRGAALTAAAERLAAYVLDLGREGR